MKNNQNKNEQIKKESESKTMQENNKEEKMRDAHNPKAIKELTEQLEKKTLEAKEYYQSLQRMAAEFDNYKKRTAKEKENIYNDTVIDVMTKFLPFVDDLDRAFCSCDSADSGKILEGLTMIIKQIKDMLKTFGITEIEAVNQSFDPELHEAVMHIQDENFGENTVTEELRKGYKCGEKVIRHSMVKVAN